MGAEAENYAEAVEIFESIARSYVDNNLLKYSAKGMLLSAGICQLCCKCILCTVALTDP